VGWTGGLPDARWLNQLCVVAADTACVGPRDLPRGGGQASVAIDEGRLVWAGWPDERRCSFSSAS
jgi:hypothetical protein